VVKANTLVGQANKLNTSRNSDTIKSEANAVNKNTNPAIFSFFSGVGFLDLGFEKSGYEIAYVNEIHRPFLEAYKYSRQRMNISQPLYGYFEGDIERCLSGDEKKNLTRLVTSTKKENRLVGFIGGPPCPDFSVGGKNRGQYGENGKLSKIYIDLICKQKPDFFVFENVV
jgi:DNA (cytosine-5)-methyltransferase 1